MAVELATAYVALVPSAKGIEARLKSEMVPPAERVGRDAGEKAGAGFRDRFQKQLGQVDLGDIGKKGLAATAVLSTGMFAAASAASSLEAAISANVQVLGEASGAIQQWAKNSVEAVGLSERAAVEATTSFGQLAKVAGLTGDNVSGFSIEMVQLAADMAAFKDVSVDVALADLQSGFAGSTEVLRKYAIFLDDAGLKQAYFRATGEEVTGTLTSQQRVIATHAEIMRQSADMQGQWGRESDGLAARQAKLKAEFENTAAALGSALLPAFTALVGGASKVVGAFASLNAETGGAVGKVAGFGTAALGVVSTGAFLANKVADISTKFRAMSVAVQGASLGLGAFGLVAAVAYTVNAAQAQAQTERLTNAISDLARASDAQALDAFGQAFVTALASDLEGGPAEALDKIVQGSLEGAKRILALAEETGRYSEVTDELSAAIQREEAARRQATATTEEYGAATDDAAESAIAAAEADAAAKEAALEQAAARDEARDAFREATKAARDQLDAIRDLYQEELSRIDAGRAYVRSVVDSKAAVAEYNEVLGDSETSQDDLLAATLRTADQLYGTAEAFAEANGATTDSRRGIELMIEELYRQAVALDPSSPLRQELLGYIADLQAIPSTVDTQVNLRIRGSNVTAGGDLITSLLGRDRARALGGPVRANELYLVGEKGPELFRPDVNGTIIPNTSLADAGDSADIYFASRQRDAITEVAMSKSIDLTEKAIDAQEDLMKIMYEVGATSLTEYRTFLQGRLASYEQYSTAWYAVWRQIQGLNNEEQRAAEAAARDDQRRLEDAARLAEQQARDEQRTRDEQIAKAFEAARAQQALAEAVREADAAYAAMVFNAQSDPLNWKFEQDALNERFARALLQRADAAANAAGLADGTIGWAQSVRAALEQDRVNAPVLAQYIDQLLIGIPRFATGGIVPARPGGMLGVIAEAGRDEAVIPLDAPRSPLRDMFADIIAYNFDQLTAGGGAGVGGDFHVHNHGRDVSVDELSRAVRLAGMR